MTEALFTIANAVLAVSSLAVAALIAAEIARRRSERWELLSVALWLVFLAVGVRAAVRVVVRDLDAAPPQMVWTVIAVDWLAAAAAAAFLALRHRYARFIGSADMVREFESGYAEKAREARSLAQVNEELRRLDELKSEFLAMVSHELRTPLTAIVGYSRLLLRQAHGPLAPKQLEQQEAIFRSAQRLSDLIDDLLDVSRLEAARIELHPVPTAAREVVEHALAAVRVAAQAKRIRVSNEVETELPAVQADGTRLHQILVNLVGNAVKFTPAGGTVRVRAGRQDGQVWIAVEDSGVGIPREELARIWDPFYQVESPISRRHGGSGLGLAIVRRLVEMHGGVVRAESEGENRGSRFSFTLPIAADQRVPEPLSDADTAIEPVLTGREVLIVEDDEPNQMLMRAVVEDVLGGRARIARDGEQAIEAALASPPALILLDLMLPGLSGWEVARRLRQHPETQAVPIVAVSALARPQEREAAFHAGCDAYLPKPFSLEDLSRVAAATLRDAPLGAVR